MWLKGYGAIEAPSRFQPSQYWWLLWALPLVMLVASRGNTPDTAAYIRIFQESDHFIWPPQAYYDAYNVEWGVGLLSYVIHIFGLSERFFLGVFSFVTFLFIRKTAVALGIATLEVLPFYLGSYFLSHQFSQIRQGLVVAVLFWAATALAERRSSCLFTFAVAVACVYFHSLSLALIAAILLLVVFIRPMSRGVFVFLCIAIAAGVFTVASFMGAFGAGYLHARIEVYSTMEAFAASRQLFEMAHVRMLLVFLCILCAPSFLLKRADFLMLSFLYTVQIGVRLGFLDFGVLSGRLGSAFSFGEIYILPLLLLGFFRSVPLRAVFAFAYLVLNVLLYVFVINPTFLSELFSDIPPAL